ncbi:hypothetical protein [Tenacibaculum maritimum]|uniref:hypothetical protein n=1 Tax=Tenacibaculum maritimum TaxID=107401 RepID=UPI00293BBF00|nr:hypothetical protein [Tenacibaculum maritimum]
MRATEAIFTGGVIGTFFVFGVALIDKLQLDDPVATVPVYLICNFWGILTVNIFGKTASLQQISIQLIRISSYVLTCSITCFIIFYLLRKH